MRNKEKNKSQTPHPQLLPRLKLIPSFLTPLPPPCSSPGEGGLWLVHDSPFLLLLPGAFHRESSPRVCSPSGWTCSSPGSPVKTCLPAPVWAPPGAARNLLQWLERLLALLLLLCLRNVFGLSSTLVPRGAAILAEGLSCVPGRGSWNQLCRCRAAPAAPRRLPRSPRCQRLDHDTQYAEMQQSLVRTAEKGLEDFVFLQLLVKKRKPTSLPSSHPGSRAAGSAGFVPFPSLPHWVT